MFSPDNQWSQGPGMQPQGGQPPSDSDIYGGILRKPRTPGQSPVSPEIDPSQSWMGTPTGGDFPPYDSPPWLPTGPDGGIAPGEGGMGGPPVQYQPFSPEGYGGDAQIQPVQPSMKQGPYGGDTRTQRLDAPYKPLDPNMTGSTQQAIDFVNQEASKQFGRDLTPDELKQAAAMVGYQGGDVRGSQVNQVVDAMKKYPSSGGQPPMSSIYRDQMGKI